MDGERFDDLAMTLTNSRGTRRRALGLLSGSALAGLLGLRGTGTVGAGERGGTRRRQRGLSRGRDITINIADGGRERIRGGGGGSSCIGFGQRCGSGDV